jgi:hypothetical protein
MKLGKPSSTSESMDATTIELVQKGTRIGKEPLGGRYSRYEPVFLKPAGNIEPAF